MVSNQSNMIHSDDKGTFIKTLNRRGFLLEDKTWKILSTQLNVSSFARNKIIDYYNERIEIDFVVIARKHHLIMECKRTDFTWIFPKAEERANTLNLIHDSDEGIQIKTRSTPDFDVAWYDIAVMFKDDNRLDVNNAGLVRTSYKDIHEHVKQVLKETEAYLSTGRHVGHIFMPVIVTNAKLCLLNYSKGNIDSDGNLTDFTDIKEVEGIVYNFPEVMRWNLKRNTITNAGDHVKTVFIVNINHLDSFISTMLDQEIGS